MLTKNKIQYIKNLHEKSGRHEAGLFLVEWRKWIMEFLESDFEIIEWYFTPKFTIPDVVDFPYEIISEKELERISTLSSNRDGLLIVKMRFHFFYPDEGGICPEDIEKKEQIPHVSEWQKNLTLILDGINDPWNLGTIIRIADWYGVTHIIASFDTVDCYNPKVIMATMWSFTRVRVNYVDLERYFWYLFSHEDFPKIYWAYLEGESIRTKDFIHWWAYLVIGSESHGIRGNLESFITDKITIPRTWLAESLNAGVATGIILERMIGL